MTHDEKLQTFEEELNLLKNEELRVRTCIFLTHKVPEYFFEIPASSTGKYHPSFDLGEGGLIRHTKMVVAVALELLRLEEYENLDSDLVIVACLLHDTFKNGKVVDGKYSEHTVTDHADIAANKWKAYLKPIYGADSVYTWGIADAIRCHMGQWGHSVPDSPLERCVHMADYIASRKFFDKF